MARVTSQKERQAILATGSLDLTVEQTEKLALFDESGAPIVLNAATNDGLPTGGETGQFLAKATDNDFEAEWVDAPEGGGSGGGTDPAYKGDWDAELAYLEGDIVRHDAVYWIATEPIDIGVEPAEDDLTETLAGSNDTDTTGGGANANGTVQQQSFTLTEDVVLSSIGLKPVNGDMAADRVLKILAADRSTLLATTVIGTLLPANVWGTIHLTAPIELIAGVTYWIEINTGFVAVGPGSGGEPLGVVATVDTLYSDGLAYTSFTIAFRIYAAAALNPWDPTEAPAVGGIPGGGTTGQILAKASSSPYDTEWVDAPAGSGGGLQWKGAYDDAVVYPPNSVVRGSGKTYVVVGTEDMPAGQGIGVNPGVPSFKGFSGVEIDSYGVYDDIVSDSTPQTPLYVSRAAQRVTIAVIHVVAAGTLSVKVDRLTPTTLDTEFALWKPPDESVEVTHTDDVWGNLGGLNAYAVTEGYYYLLGGVHLPAGSSDNGTWRWTVGPGAGGASTAVLGPVVPEDVPDAVWELLAGS